jgi:hypothetical protein
MTTVIAGRLAIPPEAGESFDFGGCAHALA